MGRMTVGRKIGAGFGVVLVLLALVAGWAVIGIGNIVGNAGQVIDGNKLRATLVQKEVDHLMWASKVSALLTDAEVTELDVQLDDHKCALGKWLYTEDTEGDEDCAAAAVALVPQIKEEVESLKEPHRLLHESGKHIAKCFQQADSHLPALLANLER
ncbi:MAG: methyl-accepting chemotaxis protein, partial [Propionibacteriaceae bacterium]|nr:methyl-accepting chemotaxis protein [Propionibacteriaceae bacterium]